MIYNVTTLHKSGIKSYPNNHRGITITSAIGKVFNSILNGRLEKFLTENKVIASCKLGFTKTARTSDHMFVLKTIIDQINTATLKMGEFISVLLTSRKLLIL